jgi:hypothetical protein
MRPLLPRRLKLGSGIAAALRRADVHPNALNFEDIYVDSGR